MVEPMSQGQVPHSDLWAQRTGPNTIAVRRGYRVVLSLVGDDEAEAVARSILALLHDVHANWRSPRAVPGHQGTCNTQTIQGIGCDCNLSHPTQNTTLRRPLDHDYQEGQFGDDGKCHAHAARPGGHLQRCYRPREEHPTPSTSTPTNTGARRSTEETS